MSLNYSIVACKEKDAMRFWGFRATVCVALSLCLLSCVKDVTMDAEEKPQVVVWCILTDDPMQELKLSFTKGASRAEAPPLTEADAILTDLTLSKVAGRFLKGRDGTWELDYAAIPEHVYRLEVQIPGYDRISAEQTMPTDAGVLSRGRFKYRIPGLHYPSLIPEEHFTPNAEDFDLLPLGQRYYGFKGLKNPLWICAVDFDAQTNRYRVADEICTTFSRTSEFNLLGRKYDPPSREDVSNEYVAESHVSKLYSQLEGAALHRKYLRFQETPQKDRGSYSFLISGNMRGRYNCSDFYQWYYGDRGQVADLQPDEGYLLFTSVSGDYDTYLLDAYAKQEISESSDLSTIYLRDNVFTNLSGGLGIFGAAIIRKMQWSGEYEYVDDGRKPVFNGEDDTDWWQ